jgi:mannosylglucosylglycerate synthase
MNKISILHYASPPIIGGVESTIYHHARLLTEAGFNVDVISGRGQKFHPDVNFHKILDIDSRQPEPFYVGQELTKGRVTPAFELLANRIYEQLTDLLHEQSILIVHNAVTLHKNLPLTSALYKIAKGHRIPTVAWCHDFAWQDELYTSDLHPGYPWDLLKTAWPGVTYVAVSEHRRTRLAELLSLPPEEIWVITPGVDQISFLGIEPDIHQLIKKLNIQDADPLGLLPARLTRRKNIEYAVQITAALKQHKPNVQLLVTGPPGPHNPKNTGYLEFLKTLTMKLGLESSVLFLYEYGQEGQPLHLSDTAIAGLYRLADFLIFPSLREGFGIPVLEAGLARLPVFAADIPPVSESAGDLAHLFDPEGNPEEAAAAIIKKLDNNIEYQLRKRVLQKFTWEAILKKDILPLIQEVCK